jgi:ferredoxin-nitrite reductase
VGSLHRKGVPASEVKQVLKEVLIEQFGAKARQA